MANFSAQKNWGLAFVLAGSLLGSGLPAPAAEPPTKNTVKAPDTKKVAPATDKTADLDKIRLINKHLAEKWKDNKIHPSDRCNDYEFIRRASLDIIGRIATPKEIQQYFKDPDNTRRSQLIDRLLASDEYAYNFANMWTVLLMTRSAQNPYREQMHRWLEKQFSEDTSYKDIVTELLTATGKTNENGAVNYILAHLGERTAKENADKDGRFDVVPITSRTTRLFLGVQTQCAQCHPHPFNKEWNQQHFWGMNAFFRQVDAPKGRPGGMQQRQQMNMVLELVDDTKLNPEGSVFYEERNARVREAFPKFLEKGSDRIEATANRRQELAKAVTSSKYFGKAYVNRMWLHFFGRGFTNPVDDFTPDNEPSHPELLDELGDEFAHYGYNPKRLIRWICNSEAYSLSSVANKTNEGSDAEPYFSRMLLKAMTPEQLFESLVVATQAEMFETKEKKRELRNRWLNSLTTNFGDDEGNEVTFNGTVVQALLMMNGNDLNAAISSKDKGTVALAYFATKKTPQAMIDTLYLSALNRHPTSRELAKINAVLRTAPVTTHDGLSFYQDLFWALLNSNEFILNH
jgi:hypothetical protein